MGKSKFGKVEFSQFGTRYIDLTKIAYAEIRSVGVEDDYEVRLFFVGRQESVDFIGTEARLLKDLIWGISCQHLEEGRNEEIEEARRAKRGANNGR